MRRASRDRESGASLFKAEDYRLTFPRGLCRDENGLKEALKQDSWRRRLGDCSDSPGLGSVGLFWALLLVRLEKERRYVICERRGRIITERARPTIFGASTTGAGLGFATEDGAAGTVPMDFGTEVMWNAPWVGGETNLSG